VPKLAANLSWLFTEVDFLARFAAAAEAGFKGVEFLFPYDFKTSALTARLAEHNLAVVLMNAPPGDWAAGERGLACLSGRQSDFQGSIGQAIAYATAIKCPKIHIMAGIAGDGARDVFVENLHFAATACAAAGVRGLIEPINDKDMPGYFLTRPDQAMDILDTVSSPALGLQLDLYHAARMGLDLGQVMDDCGNAIAHIQIAGVPERCEPDEGDVDFTSLIERIDATGYDGWIGCEYRPREATIDGLGWAFEYL
jgi:2-dehydrotetronate isomerase